MDIAGVGFNSWFPVATLIAGAVLKAIGDALLGHQQTRREREAREEMRKDGLAVRRAEFQREALLEVQNAAQVLARATGLAHHDDTMSHRASGVWGKGLVSPAANDGALDGHTRLVKFLVRVDDEMVRDLAKEMSQACVAHGFSGSESEAMHHMGHGIAVSSRLHDRIGELLRANV